MKKNVFLVDGEALLEKGDIQFNDRCVEEEGSIDMSNKNKLEKDFTKIAREVNENLQIYRTLRENAEKTVIAKANEKFDQFNKEISKIGELLEKELGGGGKTASINLGVEEIVVASNNIVFNYDIVNNICFIKRLYPKVAKARDYVKHGNVGSYTFNYNLLIETFPTIEDLNIIFKIKDLILIKLLSLVTNKNKKILGWINEERNNLHNYLTEEDIENLLYSELAKTNLKNFDDVSLEQDGVKIWKDEKKYKLDIKKED